MVNFIMNILQEVGVGYIALTVVDILIVSVLVYFVLRAIQHTRTLQLAEGIALYFIVVVALSKLSSMGHLVVLSFIASTLLKFSISFLPFLLVVVFQPELRKWFTGLGKGISIQEVSEPDEDDVKTVIDELVKSANYFSLNKIGALIVIERGVPLNDYIETGVKVNAAVRTELLDTIFFPNTSLHDGAAIIRKSKIAAARCVLPLSMDKELDKDDVGTRHRAAAGISEETDAIAIVVSEETGIISIAVRGKLTRYLSPLELRGMLLVMTKPVEKHEGLNKI